MRAGQLCQVGVGHLPVAGDCLLIRDRDAKFTAAFDAVLAAAGVRIIKSQVA